LSLNGGRIHERIAIEDGSSEELILASGFSLRQQPKLLEVKFALFIIDPRGNANFQIKLARAVFVTGHRQTKPRYWGVGRSQSI
jgi:hypothetical protein